MEFILVGQPNCGKSTIFNSIVGYKSLSSNFPGVTVKYSKGTICQGNEKIDVIDLPGTYHLNPTDQAELLAIKYLMKENSERVIINIIDSSILTRSLELTLQLMELNLPMVVCLNMIDEAHRKGVKIYSDKLSDILGVPVVETVGNRGKGIYDLFDMAYKVGKVNIAPKVIKDNNVQDLIENITEILGTSNGKIDKSHRFEAIKLIEKNSYFIEKISKRLDKKNLDKINKIISTIEKTQNNSSDVIISEVRHKMSFDIFEKVTEIGKPVKRDFRDKLDAVFMHPLFGYLTMGLFLYLIVFIIFGIGNLIEPFFVDNLTNLSDMLRLEFGENTAAYHILNGIIIGIGGAIGIVIPYLIPFFLILSFLEDSGYLARIAYLADNLMHKLGLHGLSIVPLIFGYGCTVPGILAARILKSPRDKFITIVMTTLIPCSAKMVIILGLIAFFISVEAAILIYVFNIIIVGIVGKILSKINPEVSPGLILEMPKYQLPSLKAILVKIWFRLKEFILIALPLLVVGSVILELVKYFDWIDGINSFLAPFTSVVLGLPKEIGIVLLFGILRKELALLLLFSAIGTQDVPSVLSVAQIFSFTIFVTFYIPCLATIATMIKELNLKYAILITVLNTVLAAVLAVLVRFAVMVV
ncbi:MAG: ferrous iron transport protein B [Ignavibacteriales bacterium]|nr:ferrous iron transport protein B [Ignavibacteriales bacterium]